MPLNPELLKELEKEIKIINSAARFDEYLKILEENPERTKEHTTHLIKI